ncbi:hypothetical protein KUA19_36945 [Catellatospora sp. NEAU-YM18]|nr:hypothetical protein [Catellatospora tritici]
MEQITAAMTALGMYTGAGTAAEHAEQAGRLGGAEVYRVRMANALLGMVQGERLLADSVPLDNTSRHAA